MKVCFRGWKGGLGAKLPVLEDFAISLQNELHLSLFC